jgi:uncharacterized membrane protein (DUF106 family)
MPKTKPQPDSKKLHLAVIKQIAALATSGFGLVAALAWNAVITELVNTYIKPLVGPTSGLISLFLYAVIVTVLAVLITVQLSELEQRVESLNEKISQRIKNRKR